MNQVQQEVDKALDALDLHFPTHSITLNGRPACTVGDSFIIREAVTAEFTWVVEQWNSERVAYSDETKLSTYGPSKSIASCFLLRYAVAIAVGRTVEEYLCSPEYVCPYDDLEPEEPQELSEDRP